MIFGWAQIIMDIQPLFVLVTGEGHLHGFSHTFAGAMLLGTFSAVSGKYLMEFGMKLVDATPSKANPARIPISWLVAITSACIGTYSHVVLDSIMHSDVQPYFPFSLENHFLRLVAVGSLHQICLYSALIGSVLHVAVQYLRRS